jgi:hypothetical protein
LANLFVSKEKRAMCDLIISDIGKPMPAKKKMELKALLATHESDAFIVDGLFVISGYRPSLYAECFDAALENKHFLQKTIALDAASLLIDYALIVGQDAAVIKFIKLAEKDYFKKPLLLMVDLTVDRYLHSLTMALFDSGLLAILGIDLKALLAYSYDKYNQMLCFFLESHGVHLEIIPPKHAGWYTDFGTSSENQMDWLSKMSEFRLSVGDINGVFLDGSHGFSKLNNEPKLCFKAMCAADYYRNINGIEMNHFSLKNREGEEIALVESAVISHHDMTIEIKPGGISVITDSGYTFEKFITRLFMEMLFKKDYRYESEIRSAYTEYHFDEFASKEQKDLVVKLLRSSLETLKACRHNTDTLSKLSFLLSAFDSINDLDESEFPLEDFDFDVLGDDAFIFDEMQGEAQA